MSYEAARDHLALFGLADRIQLFEVSSATVELAAQAVGVEGARIAKTLSFRVGDGYILILAAGDARIDNHKYKQTFHKKAAMPSPDEVLREIGHPVGGVCPFGIRPGVKVYLDESLKRFDVVYPAAGTPSSAVKLSLEELFLSSGALGWVDVTKLPEES